MKQKSLILMSTLLVCSLESFAQSDVEKNDSIWKDFDLASVTVVASKPLVKMETDKMTYNVQQDADAKASTVLDMLRKVPMVTVDGLEQYRLFVDGEQVANKPNNRNGRNVKQQNADKQQNTSLLRLTTAQQSPPSQLPRRRATRSQVGRVCPRRCRQRM